MPSVLGCGSGAGKELKKVRFVARGAPSTRNRLLQLEVRGNKHFFPIQFTLDREQAFFCTKRGLFPLTEDRGNKPFFSLKKACSL